MTLAGVIFDLDGVIIDTVPLHFQAWKKMFAEYGKDFTFDDYKIKVDGILRFDGARAILRDLSDEGIEAAAAKKQQYFLEFLDAQGVPLYQETIDFIEELREADISTAVISSSKNCRDILRRIGIIHLFKAVVSGDEIVRGKPSPDIFLLAAERMRLAPGQCVVIEDAIAGIQAARKAGMKCVGFDRYDDSRRLAHADIVVRSAAELTVARLVSLLS